jgi:hypothetical protein
VDVDGLAAECRAARAQLGLASSGWTARAVGAALHQAVVEGGRPVDVAVRALLRVAADPATRVPGRLVCDGPWWDAVAAPALTPSSQEEQAELAELEARLAEADGLRVWGQRRARQELAARGEPVTRLAVARLACRFLAEGRVGIA